MDSVEDNKKLHEFRRVLHNIKSTTIDKITSSTQNTNGLRMVEQRLQQFYMLLKPVIVDGKPFEMIPLETVRDLFYSTLHLEKDEQYSSYYRNQLKYYLERDFIDFPFTIDEEEIDIHQPEEHYGERKVIDNDSSLTKLSSLDRDE